jgi:hypothetical protein
MSSKILLNKKEAQKVILKSQLLFLQNLLEDENDQQAKEAIVSAIRGIETYLYPPTEGEEISPILN